MGGIQDSMDRKLNLNRAETFSFVNPWIRYFLFFFSFLFWVSKSKGGSLQSCPSPSSLASVSTSLIACGDLCYTVVFGL